MRIRKKYLRKPAKKAQWTFKVNYSVVTTTVALFITLSTFYLTWFHKNHSLAIAITEVNINGQSKDSDEDDWFPLNTNIKLALANTGNRSEILHSARIVITNKEDREDQIDGPAMGPIIIKPGEITPLEMKWELQHQTTISAFSSPDADGYRESTMKLNIETISPNGEVSQKSFPLATLQIREKGMVDNEMLQTLLIEREDIYGTKPYTELIE